MDNALSLRVLFYAAVAALIALSCHLNVHADTIYSVSRTEAEQILSKRLMEQYAAGNNLQAKLMGKTEDTLFASHTPFTTEIRNLNVQQASRRFLAELVFVESEVSSHDAEHDPVLSTLRIQGSYDAFVKVPVLRDSMERGRIIHESDIQWISLPESNVRRDTVTDPARIIGMSPRRFLAPGRPVTQDDVRAPTVVRAGDMVTMMYQTRSMDLQATGNALNDGAVGDTITVRNTQTKAILQGIVEAPGIVRIAMPGHNTRGDTP